MWNADVAQYPCSSLSVDLDFKILIQRADESLLILNRHFLTLTVSRDDQQVAREADPAIVGSAEQMRPCTNQDSGAVW